MTARHIEIALSSSWFPCRVWIVVPRVSWGMGLNECDLLALSGSGFAHSVEIKVSVGDLRREFRKRKYDPRTGRYLCAYSEDRWFKARWFAIPLLMREKALPLIPNNFGILCVNESGTLEMARKPLINRKAVKWPLDRQLAITRNCTIKYWKLVAKNHHQEKGR